MSLHIKKWTVFLGVLLLASTVSAEVIYTPEGAIVTHYPSKFDRMVTLEEVREEGIVVDDMFIPYSERVKFMTPRNRFARQKRFSQGSRVGFVLNDMNQIDVMCLFPKWLNN